MFASSSWQTTHSPPSVGLLGRAFPFACVEEAVNISGDGCGLVGRVFGRPLKLGVER